MDERQIGLEDMEHRMLRLRTARDEKKTRKVKMVNGDIFSRYRSLWVLKVSIEIIENVKEHFKKKSQNF